MRSFAPYAQPAFTLAELLIALAILGVIATFTIPKILSAQQAEKRKSIFRETYAALSQTLYEGIKLKGQVTDTSSYWIYLQSNLNAVKYCTNASTEGCWPGASDNVNNTPSRRGILLHNGAMITDFDFGNPSADNLWIDWNGTVGPNMHCEDQIPVVVFHSSTTFDGISGQATQVKYRINPPGGAGVSCASSVFDAL